ncbi:C-type lectin domain family 4 member D-like [Patiria miniata]|uniref:C-type lectin domain-containing protein n=1 Tax=Patiria miniata TaxID=46514 RepID=A0A913Z6Q6_PATMI|nr:C-type lectin domain family 4 member D-like [Patiria miniata]
MFKMLYTLINRIKLLIWMTTCADHVIVTACPQGWYQWHNSCYIGLEEKLTWFDAMTTCQRPGGGLFVPNQREEHEFIMKLRDKVFSEFDTRHLWIGCDIVDGNRRCAGRQNANSVYTNWASDGGNDRIGQFCIAKGPYQDGELYLSDCYARKCVMCEMPCVVPSYCASLGTDGRVAPCLHGHEIKNLTVQGVSECGQACWAEPRCRSFNLWQGGPAKTCQLNDVTSNEVSADNLTEQGKCTFFEL